MFTTRVKSFAVLAILSASLFLRHANSAEVLNSEAESFLKEHSSESADSSWERAFHERAARAMSENESISDEERYADDKALEFFFDKKKSFEESSANPLSAKDKIEVARWYLLFFNHGWRMPSRIAAHLTKSNYERYVASK